MYKEDRIDWIEEYPRIMEYREKGLSLEFIGRHYGVSKQAIQQGIIFHEKKLAKLGVISKWM